MKSIDELTGLELIQAMMREEIPPPPVGKFFGIQFISAEEGEVELTAVASPRLINPIQVVHGGFSAVLIDTAAGVAVQTMTGPGEFVATVQMSINLIRSVPLETTLYCSGKSIHLGRNIATGEAFLRDGKGKLYAHGQVTMSRHGKSPYA